MNLAIDPLQALEAFAPEVDLPGRSQPFPGEQGIEHPAALESVLVLELQRGILEKAFLARCRDVERYVPRRQKSGNSVHPMPNLPTRARASLRGFVD